MQFESGIPSGLAISKVARLCPVRLPEAFLARFRAGCRVKGVYQGFDIFVGVSRLGMIQDAETKFPRRLMA